MAISNIDQALAGMQHGRLFHKALTGTMVIGRPVCTWGLAGIPGTGAYDTTLAGATVSASDPGAIDFSDPVSGNSYLARFIGSATATGTIILIDRLWHNGNISPTSTSPQTVNSVTFPARDRNGSTNGEGVYLGVEISAAMGSGSPTITVDYTNSAGTSSRTATNIYATGASAPARTFYPIGLQAGDIGVRSVQSLTLSATWTSGTMNLVAYRELARIEVCLGNIPASLDVLSGGFPRIFNGSALSFIFVPGATTSSHLFGSLVWTQG